MPMSKALKEAQQRYRSKENENKPVQVVLQMSAAQRQQINDYCKPRGGTAKYMKQLLYDDMRLNGVEPLSDQK